jgi:hypothetical protein
MLKVFDVAGNMVLLGPEVAEWRSLKASFIQKKPGNPGLYVLPRQIRWAKASLSL